jgi:uncharacterized protein YbbK (DUF523 family)
MAKEKILLSACLAGVNCVYDGTNKFHPVFAKMFKNKEAILVCPEVLGKLKIPHEPSEMIGGDGFSVLAGKASVRSKTGLDVTENFVKGAKVVLVKSRKYNIKKAILKSKSPSCGCGFIFDGTFSKKLVAGFGVTAALLKQNGVIVVSDVEYLKSQSMVDSP